MTASHARVRNTSPTSITGGALSAGAGTGTSRLGAVRDRLRELAHEDERAFVQSFVGDFYRLVPPEDLDVRTPEDLAGTVLAAWRRLAACAPGQRSAAVFNPNPERDGFDSPHTIVQLVTDDMPFIVDTVTLELSRAGYPLHFAVHPVVRVRRDHEHRITALVDRDADAPDARGESVLHIEIERESDPQRRIGLQSRLEQALNHVAEAVEDWHPMRAAAIAMSDELGARAGAAHGGQAEELTAASAFLRWLAEDHFTFLGYREYDLALNEPGAPGNEPRTADLIPRRETGRGILRGEPRRPRTTLSPDATRQACESAPLVLTKANSRSPVHRGAYLDYVGVKRFDADGNVTGERRFLGLYTSTAYHQSAQRIPLLQGKIERVLRASGFPRDSHDAKSLIQILESYPRDALFQARPAELYDIAMGILALGERQRVRLFLRRDPLGRFADCLVCLPRDRMNTTTRERVASILQAGLGGEELDWTIQPSDSVLARVHFIVRCRSGVPADLDTVALEAEIAEAVRGWEDALRQALIEAHGRERAVELAGRYRFGPVYRDERAPQRALDDIEQLEALGPEGERIVLDEQPSENGTTRCRLFSARPVSLSDVLPTLERLGTAVVDERPYEIGVRGSAPVWMYDFGLRDLPPDAGARRELFHGAFLGIRRGELEDDGLGALVLGAGLNGRQVTIVRAVARYLRQAGIQYSNAYMERTLVGHPDVARGLVDLFAARLDPQERDSRRVEWVAERLTHAIEAVESLDEDRILRAFHSVVVSILRTNHYRAARPADTRPCLSFKLDPHAVELLPEPRPQFEVFVYSPQVEAVHLRGGKVARGGLRWSDRPEDFRTEVLGLMKAQMVKNALIVPVGSKGGFVVKQPPAERDALQREAIECYRTFLAGLLDLTDNIVAGEVVPPADVIRHDGDDPYLVVAADKGTATFSDIANRLSADYGFWLGDAFASGGSNGYDHKRMGITARGAWESVRRHFRELGTDVDTERFTVVGIGDMSGDVFGNGMLLSPHIKLVAAFNHRHVFIDPDPDPETAYAERRRLFELDRSGWDDYDPEKLSAGGGVHDRAAKRIRLSDEARRALGTEASELSPPELIRTILRAPVDLLWNGGIGTYVKASTETHAEVGDKSADALRVDGRELRCRVVGEGGNLGLTQRGRIEYALGGGRVNTDAIDNVGGVNCSDHEVNIKILLDGRVAAGALTPPARNDLLEEMTDAVADRVIAASYTQTQALSLARHQAAEMIDVHRRMIRYLEAEAGLRRELEFLPSDDELSERAADGRGLTSPELAVLLAHAKIHLYSQLLESELHHDESLEPDLERYFPDPLPERYDAAIHEHRLRREILATLLANELVDRAGSTFAFRLGEETGAPAHALASAFAVAEHVFEMRRFWTAVEALDNLVAADVQLDVLIEARRLVERSARWLVRANPRGIDVPACAERFTDGVRMVRRALPELLAGDAEEKFETRLQTLRESEVPDPLARLVAAMPVLLPGFDIVEVAEQTGRDPDLVMRVHFGLGRRLELDWLRERILELPRSGRWEALARAALRDDLQSLHRQLTVQVLAAVEEEDDAERAIERWAQSVGASALDRSLGMLADVRAGRTYDTTTLPVALRELRSLTS